MRKFLVLFVAILFLTPNIALPEATYEVKEGDTLWNLAENYLDNPFMWNKIYDANKDKIEDPHWIYPGQVFIIPDAEGNFVSQPEEAIQNTPIEEGMTSDMGDTEGKYMETEEYVQDVPQETVAKIEEKTKKLDIVKTDIEKIKKEMIFGRMSDQMAYKGGFISNEKMKIGELTGGVDKEYSGSLIVGEKAYAKLLKGLDIKVGDKLSVYREKKGIKNYNDSGKFGNLYYFVGTVQVTSISGDICEVQALEVFDRINMKGEKLTYYRNFELPVVKELSLTADPVEGYIIIGQETIGSLLPNDLVYINLGNKDGIKSGDIFEIVRFDKKANAELKEGELQVLYVTENTSSAVLLNTSDNMDIGRGYKIRKVLDSVYE